MGWLQSLRLNAAAKACARQLEPWLRRQWGAAETYSRGQIERAAKEVGLASAHLGFAYDCFLTGDHLARERLNRFRPLVSSFDPPGESEGVRAAASRPD